MLKLRTIGLSDYSVLEGRQRIGGSAWPQNAASGSKSEFKAAWEALKARSTPEQLAAAYRAMNIRDDG